MLDIPHYTILYWVVKICLTNYWNFNLLTASTIFHSRLLSYIHLAVRHTAMSATWCLDNILCVELTHVQQENWEMVSLTVKFFRFWLCQLAERFLGKIIMELFPAYKTITTEICTVDWHLICKTTNNFFAFSQGKG